MTSADDPLARLNANLQRLGHPPIKWDVQPSTSYHVTPKIDERTLQLLGDNAYVYSTVSNVLRKGKRSIEAKKAKRAIAHALSGALEMVRPSLKNENGKKRKRGAQREPDVEEEEDAGAGAADPNGGADEQEEGELDEDDEEDDDTSQQQWPQGASHGQMHPPMTLPMDAQHARWLASSRAAALLAGEPQAGTQRPQRGITFDLNGLIPAAEHMNPMQWLRYRSASDIAAGDVGGEPLVWPQQQRGAEGMMGSQAQQDWQQYQHQEHSPRVKREPGSRERPLNMEKIKEEGLDEEDSDKLRAAMENGSRAGVGGRGGTRMGSRSGSGAGTGQTPRKRKRTFHEADVAAERMRKNMRRE